MLAAWILYLPSVRYGFVYYDDVRILLNRPAASRADKLVRRFARHFRDRISPGRTVAVARRDLGARQPHFWIRQRVRLSPRQRVASWNRHRDDVHHSCWERHGVMVSRWRFQSRIWCLGIDTEPVVWIMGRKDILSTLFMLLALCAQTRRLAAGNRTGQMRVVCGHAFLFRLFGLFSKISVLTFPLVLLLHAIFLPYLNGERPSNGVLLWGRNLAKEILLFLPAFAISVLVYEWYRRTLTRDGHL